MSVAICNIVSKFIDISENKVKSKVKNMEEIQKQVKKIVIEYLVKDGHLNMFALTEFIYFDMSKELGKSIIGLENYKKANPDRIKEIDMKICLAHDIGGILRGDKMFIPRSLSYTEYYENN